MIIETSQKSIKLVFTTRKIVNLVKGSETKNLEDLYFQAMNKNDIEALTVIIKNFAENVEDGSNAFKNDEELYEFIDVYKSEKNKTYEDIFKEIALAINEEGFFQKKMTAEEIEEKISNPLSSINLNEVVQESAQKAISDMVVEGVKISKG